MTWTPVPDYPNYEAHPVGMIRSVPRKGTAGGVLVQTINNMGYLQVNLSINGRTATVRTHVLIAATFLGPRPEGALIRHLDGQPFNNSVSNLAYGTYSENEKDKAAHGTNVNAAKTHCKNDHPFDDENTKIINDGRGRRCRQCERDRQARYRKSLRRAS